jgi:hypothetical protein
VFVTSQGSLHGQFQRAVERGNVLQAVAIARDLGELSLSSSFALLLLFAEHDPERFNRAAPRWHARFVLSAGGLSLEEAQSVLASLGLLPGPTGCAGVHRAGLPGAWNGARRACGNSPEQNLTTAAG